MASLHVSFNAPLCEFDSEEQTYGWQVQRYLRSADAEHYTSCMPSHLLFQYGKIGNESKDLTIPHGTFRHQCYHECVHAYQFR